MGTAKDASDRHLQLKIIFNTEETNTEGSQKTAVEEGLCLPVTTLVKKKGTVGSWTRGTWRRWQGFLQIYVIVRHLEIGSKSEPLSGSPISGGLPEGESTDESIEEGRHRYVYKVSTRKERTNTAYHEAGHAVVALHFGVHVKSVDIIPVPDEDSVGFCLTSSRLWDFVFRYYPMHCLGGPVAEFVHRSRGLAGAVNISCAIGAYGSFLGWPSSVHFEGPPSLCRATARCRPRILGATSARLRWSPTALPHQSRHAPHHSEGRLSA